MNEYLKQYIKLQKPFRVTQGNPDSVCALYAFKDELEQSEDKQAKEILVVPTLLCVAGLQKERLRPALPDRRPLR